MSHTCHWPGCGREVSPKLWGCKAHWYELPAWARALVWKHYRPGQEIDKRPSPEYIAAAQRVQRWIAESAPKGAMNGERND